MCVCCRGAVGGGSNWKSRLPSLFEETLAVLPTMESSASAEKEEGGTHSYEVFE